jgi:chloramphenicol 3-O-phosphotransferase
MPEVLILTGPPAAGKSTVARALAERYDRVTHIQVDDLRHMITPTGYVHPGRPGWELQHRLAVRNACDLARNFLEERFAVIIDDVVDQDDLSYYLEGLESITVPVHLVLLLPSLEVCLARNVGRQQVKMSVEMVWQQFEAARNAGWATIDSSELTVYETADRLQALTTSGESLIRS